MIFSILSTWANIYTLMMACHRLTVWLTFSQSAYYMCLTCAVNLNKLRRLCNLENKKNHFYTRWIIFIFRIGSIFPCWASHSEATTHETNSLWSWHLSSELCPQIHIIFATLLFPLFHTNFYSSIILSFCFFLLLFYVSLFQLWHHLFIAFIKRVTS